MSNQKYPEPTVGALVVNAFGQVLLLRSHKWPAGYALPGGHVEVGERLEDAVVREVKEETGLDVFDLEFLCFQEYISAGAFWRDSHFIFFDFVCRTDQTRVTLSEEAEAFVWADLDEAEKLLKDPFTRRVLGEYKERHR